jgi:hypothetical protein
MNRYGWVKKQSSAGNTYFEVEDLMAITSSFFQIIIYIYPTVALAKAGNTSKGGGTGFLVEVKSDDTGHVYMYAVTNAHVIEEMKSLALQTCAIRFNTVDDDVDVIEIELSSWKLHPARDDVAIYLLEPSEHWRHNAIDSSALLRENMIHGKLSYDPQNPDHTIIPQPSDDENEEKWVEIPRVGIGDETITIGMYGLHAGKSYNLPVARFGHISMLPFEPVYQDDRDYEQDSFLVETHSIGGLSGSPVLIQTVRHEKHKRENGSDTAYKETVFVIGVDWGHFNDKRGLPSGMMGVVPAWKVLDLLYLGEVDMARKELDKEFKKKKTGKTSTDSTLSKEEFEAVLKKVAQKKPPK